MTYVGCVLPADDKHISRRKRRNFLIIIKKRKLNEMRGACIALPSACSVFRWVNDDYDFPSPNSPAPSHSIRPSTTQLKGFTYSFSFFFSNKITCVLSQAGSCTDTRIFLDSLMFFSLFGCHLPTASRGRPGGLVLKERIHCVTPYVPDQIPKKSTRSLLVLSHGI